MWATLRFCLRCQRRRWHVHETVQNFWQHECACFFLFRIDVKGQSVLRLVGLGNAHRYYWGVLLLHADATRVVYRREA